MNAVIITIGDEILIGQIVDTNAAWIAQKLTLTGIQIREIVSISDSPEHIRSVLDRIVGRTDVIILTGGLGPTKDDLTKQTLTEYFGGRLVMNEEVLARITKFFSDRGRRMIESNHLQAMLPDNCTVLPNNEGTAQGMWFTQNGSHIFSIPGVPYEMKPLIENEIIPVLRKTFDVPALVHRTVMTEGVPESFLARIIQDWEDALPRCVKLAYLPRPGIVRLRLTASGECAEDAKNLLNEQIEKLEQIIGEHVFGYDDVSLQEVLGNVLSDRRLSISTAESCTGGNIARMITSVPGSSGYFKGAIIAYSNAVKTKELGVPPETIAHHGAVSREVVERMASGSMERFGTDTSIAVSGIAGPDGGTEDKPVGTVWIAVGHGKKIVSTMFRFGGDRSRIIDQSSIMGMGLLRKLLLGKMSENV
jgi:nicotinamide-nucleotide amidase